MNRVPVSLIVDDSGPVNMYFFHDPGTLHEMLVPPVFLRKFSGICKKYGVKGKFSIVPMPAGLGRIDEKLCRVPALYVRRYLKTLKKEIEPVFSVTPEILTHFLAWDLSNSKKCLHLMEDAYFSKLSAEQIAEYVGLALQITINVGLNPAGVTSPWSCGLDNEANYAAGIGMAFRNILKRESCFYFLHCQDEVQKPVLMCDSAESGKVFSIPANTFDAFWDTQNPVASGQAVRNVRENVEKLLSSDGRTGLIRELFEKQLPITLLTHWQSLYSDGRCIGLDGLETLVKRINKVFGTQVEWMNFEELAKL